MIEEIADAVFGVTEVDNRLRVGTQGGRGTASAAGSEVGGEDTGSSTADSAGISPERTLNKS
ncbi:hypothetical protein D3C81_1644340 [compost metagenome]